MANKTNSLLHSLSVTKDAKAAVGGDDAALTDLMANPEYLRHSSSIINDALKDGFDVLQLPNGDIVATGTKTIVHTYSWDEAKASLVKVRTVTDRPRSKRASKRSKEEADE